MTSWAESLRPGDLVLVRRDDLGDSVGIVDSTPKDGLLVWMVHPTEFQSTLSILCDYGWNQVDGSGTVSILPLMLGKFQPQDLQSWLAFGIAGIIVERELSVETIKIVLRAMWNSIALLFEATWRVWR